jgi:hypothetical protein
VTEMSPSAPFIRVFVMLSSPLLLVCISPFRSVHVASAMRSYPVRSCLGEMILECLPCVFPYCRSARDLTAAKADAVTATTPNIMKAMNVVMLLDFLTCSGRYPATMVALPSLAVAFSIQLGASIHLSGDGG